MSDCRPSANHSWTFHTVPVGSSRAAHTRETEEKRGYGSETVVDLVERWRVSGKMGAADIRAALAVLRVEHVVVGLLAFALGFHNATVHHIGIPNLSTTTVLTMNLTALGGLFRGGLALPADVEAAAELPYVHMSSLRSRLRPRRRQGLLVCEKRGCDDNSSLDRG